MAGKTEIRDAFRNRHYHDRQQHIFKGLFQEVIARAGFQTYYLPRKVHTDGLFGETENAFEEAIPVVMYLENAEGWGGDGDIPSKFGLQIVDDVELYTSIYDWQEGREITLHTGEVIKVYKPHEGDLIYIPFLTDIIVEINFVESDEPFYQFGTQPAYKLYASKFEWSGEDFEVPEENEEDLETLNQIDDSLREKVLADDPEAVVESETAEFENVDLTGVIDFTEGDPFSDWD